jgi:hypothetical protein
MMNGNERPTLTTALRAACSHEPRLSGAQEMRHPIRIRRLIHAGHRDLQPSHAPTRYQLDAAGQQLHFDIKSAGQ